MFIKVKVFPDSKKERVQQNRPDSFHVYTREPAKDTLANRRMLEMMVEFLNKPPGSLRIVKGHTSPSKILKILD